MIFPLLRVGKVCLPGKCFNGAEKLLTCFLYVNVRVDRRISSKSSIYLTIYIKVLLP